MAVKKTQMYRRNLDGTETNLNPLTESQYVLMENGQTVQEVLSDKDSDKYTPVITNSSSTFKVGQGDNVDLSSSMKEGAYDSCVLKGKTMVNCIQESSSRDIVLPYEFADGRYVTINDTKESGALGVELKGQTLVNTLIYEHTSLLSGATRNGDTITLNKSQQWSRIHLLPSNSLWIPNETYTTILYDVVGDTSTLHMCSQNGGVATKTPFTNNKAVFTMGRGRDTDNDNRLGYIESTTIVENETVSFKAIILKGDYSDVDVPYFTGMASCKMPILHTVSKNLFSREKVEFNKLYIQEGNLNANKEGRFSEANGLRSLTLSLPQNENFTFSIGHPTGNLRIFASNEKPSIGVKGKKIFGTQGTKVATFNTGDYKYFTIVYYSYNSDNTSGKTEEETIATIQIEEGSAPTSYEAHKSSILSLPEEVVLRSLPNGVCDTFNTRTGVYTQRIYETKFVPSLATSNNQWVNSAADWTNENARGVYVNFDNLTVPCPKQKRSENVVGQYILCDKLKQIPRSSSAGAFGGETKGIVYSSSYMGVMLPKSELREDSKESVLEWLETNQCSIVYELETPIVTKINLPSILKSWNTTTHIYSEIPENTLHPTLSHSNPTYPVILKPSTKYSIVASSYSNGHTNSPINFNLGGATASTTVGNRVTTITTPSTLSNELLTMSGRGNKLNNVMVIEGDVVGDEPYFEGICDSKSPILSNVGKNLFDEQRHSNPDNFFVHSAYWSIPIRLKGNTEYRFSYTFNNVLDKQVVMRFATCKWTSTDHSSYPYSLGQVLNRNITSNLMGKTDSMSFVTPADGLVYLHYYNTELTNSPSSFNLASWYTHILKDIQLEESSTSTQCEPYKSNTTTFDQKDNKTIVLRSLPSGVCDTLNVETGEYVQRIGEIVLDGSYIAYSNQSSGGYPSATSTAVLLNLKSSEPPQNRATEFVCKDLPHYPAGDSIWTKHTPIDTGISGVSGAWDFCIRLPYTVTGGTSTDSNDVIKQKFKEYLNANPVTVQYELATPIVSTIDVQGFPYAYTSGHVQLTSGHSGQSLTPKVEYSLSANKTGQINSNTKRVSAQQKQLDDFEAMMLTSMVQSAYDKAILQFDYEMRMMSLGGE